MSEALKVLVLSDDLPHAGPREKLLESFLKQTIEGAVILTLHPRTIVSITVQVKASPDHIIRTSPTPLHVQVKKQFNLAEESISSQEYHPDLSLIAKQVQ